MMRAGSILEPVQNPGTLRMGGLLVALIMPHVAIAAPSEQPGGQLIIESFAAVSAKSPDPLAGTAASRSVQDITLGFRPVRAATPAIPVADMMAAQFATAPRTQLVTRSVSRVYAGIRPATAKLATSQALGAPMVDYQPAADSCEVYPYKPSKMLKAENEAYRQMLLPYVVHEACSAGIPAGLLDALIIQESRYNALAISNKGAVGLTQLMPVTASKLGANAYSVEDNIRGGAAYLRSMLDTFGGQAHLALAAYNAGPGAVIRHGGIPAFRETQGYVASILSLWGSLSQ